MKEIVFNRFMASLERFNKMNIQDAIGYEKWNEMFISHHSTSIEGSSLTVDESMLLLAENITAKGKPLKDHLMVTNHHNALIQTIEYARNKERMTLALLRHLSSLVMKDTGSIVHTIAGSFDVSNGDFRLAMVRVDKRYFMDYKKVPEAVEMLCNEIVATIDDLQSIKEMYNMAFDVHFGLVSIHPFGDGNGRVSRLLMNYVLQYHKQPLALIFSEDKADYFNALEESREQDSYIPFRNFMYSQQTKFFEQEIGKLNRGTKWSLKRG